MTRLIYLSLLFVVYCSAAATEVYEEEEIKSYNTVSTSNVETEYETSVSENTVEESTGETSESISESYNDEELDIATTQESRKKNGFKICPPNEIFQLKKKSCPPDTCASLVTKYDCSHAPPPKPGCTCKSGFKRLNGKCVPKCKCPQIAFTPQCHPYPVTTQKPSSCGLNEIEVCAYRCPPEKTCANRDIVYRCARDKSPCRRKCVCRPGYFRNSVGICVLAARCEPKCGLNEVAVEVCPKCPPKMICIAVPGPCKWICKCKPGYIRNNKGICVAIPPKPSCCGLNEEEKCVIPNCPENTCQTRNIVYDCFPNEPCTNQCRCKKGYYRNAIGECVSNADCDKCTKPHEFFDCGTACDNECKTLGIQNRTHCPIINVKCNEKCYCEDGYARDDQGNCIPVDQCPTPPKPSCCGLNEEEKCVIPNCPENTCQTRNIIYDCFPNEPCTNQCRCKKGYYRNAIGVCVSNADCDKCTKPHEFFDCGTACDNECKTLGIQNRTHCPIINVKCNEKCYCEDGYARDDQGNCIPVDQCPTPPKPSCCGLNEEEKCVIPNCPENTCQTRNIIYDCFPNEPCTNQCRCKKGYYRNAIGECISNADCDQCTKPHEFFTCGPECDNECRTLGIQNRTNCPIINKKCNEKCYCEDGYARDDNGNCIPVDQCCHICSDPNEEYILTRSCPPDLCISIVSSYSCPDEIPTYRCRCKSGFLRKTVGSPCIPKQDC